MSGSMWQEIASLLAADGREFIRRAGWGDVEIDALAVASKRSEVRKNNALLPSQPINGRPPAEIVSTAQMIQTAETILKLDTLEYADQLPAIMFILGQEEARASLFQAEQGHPPEAAIDAVARRQIGKKNAYRRDVEKRQTTRLQIRRAEEIGSESPEVRSRNIQIRILGKVFAKTMHHTRVAG